MVLHTLIYTLKGILLFLFLRLINCPVASSNGHAFPLARSLLTTPRVNQDVALVAAVDGTFYLINTNTGEVKWSFSSGSRIYSSFQAGAAVNPADEKRNATEPEAENELFYLDCGEDWELYLHSSRTGKLQKVGLSAEEYIRRLPYVWNNGQVTLGLKKTSAFIVDAKTGKLLKTYTSESFSPSYGFQSPDNSPVLLVNAGDPANVEGLYDNQHVIYFSRTDYVLRHYSPNSTEVLWSLAFADIEAEFRCLKVGTSISYDTQWDLPCQMKTSVLRIRDHELLKSDKFPIIPVGYSSSLLPEGSSLLQLPPALSSGSDNGNVGYIPMAEQYHEKMIAPLPLPSNEETQKAVQLLEPSSHGAHLVDRVKILLWPALSALAGFSWYAVSAMKKQRKVKESVKEGQSVGPKKKKNRKVGGKTAISSHLEEPEALNSEKIGRNMLSFLTTVDSKEGRRVGKLLVLNKEIAKGSNGTVVLEGIYDGRCVAVKRLVQSHHEVAVKEIQNLIASDQHPNIVRWYGVEHDTDFIYIALERCTCNLNDLIYTYSETFHDNLPTKLWKRNGYPSPVLLHLIRDVVRGLSHLHDLGMIHRDLKPQNVLILNEKTICAKISDMGISKRLTGDVSALTQHATGWGSSGWGAPEQLQQGRQTRAVDLFSLGCVIFFCITGGKHPFGDNIERDVNILNNKKDLFLVENLPEVMDLLTTLLHPNPDQRPKARDVLNHPLFWNPDKRLSFLQDASDRVELEDRESGSELLEALERSAAVALNGTWEDKLEAVFIHNIGRYRRYRYDSIRDLLRVIRNKSHHYRELPEEVKELLGVYPDEFEAYFSKRFPKLLIEVYKIFHHFCKDEPFFRKYTDSDVAN